MEFDTEDSIQTLLDRQLVQCKCGEKAPLTFSSTPQAVCLYVGLYDDKSKRLRKKINAKNGIRILEHIYHLCSVISHTGHFYCDKRKHTNGKWSRYDDEKRDLIQGPDEFGYLFLFQRYDKMPEDFQVSTFFHSHFFSMF